MDVTDPRVFHLLTDHVLGAADQSTPWQSPDDFAADTGLLGRLLSIPLRQGKGQQAGLFAKAADAWVAHELRRAGFGDDEVWPRARQPRVLPAPLARLERELRPEDRAALRKLVKGNADARLLGAYYDKQVDVVIADWDRGAELMVSTRSMLSSYKNNLHNRSEDLVGDADNLRGRYPLAAIGLLFVVRSNIFDEAGALPFIRDMMLRMRSSRLYDASGLVIAQWDDTDVGTWPGDVDEDQLPGLLRDPDMVAVLDDATPNELSAGTFFTDLVGAVLERTPVNYHVEVRERRSGTPLGLDEAD